MAKNTLTIPAKDGTTVNSAGNKPGALAPVQEELDIARKFMRENPKGSLPDAPEEVQGVGDVAIVPAEPFGADPIEPNAPDPVAAFESENVAPQPEVPPVVAPETSAPVAADAKPAETTPGATPASQAEATAPTPEAAAAAAPASEVKQTYDPSEKIYLHESVEPWTREQIVAALQDRAQMQPKAQEAEQFRSLLGADYAQAEQVWKPILETLRSQPERTAMLDSLLQADPGTLQYIRESLDYYRSLPADQRYPEQSPGNAATSPHGNAIPATDPRFAQYDRALKSVQKQAINARVRSELETVYTKYPHLRTDEAARRALLTRAGEMFKADEAAGKDPLDARGLIDAMNESAVFLEATAIAYAARTAPQAAPVVPQPVGVPAGASAILGSGGPTSSAPSQPAKRTVYRGNPDDAVAAFLQDHPAS